MSTLKFNTWQDNAGTRTYAPCTAWVNFNGTGVVSINDQENVASITDNGTGDYDINFTVAMANTNYSVVCSASGVSAPFTYMSAAYAKALGNTSVACQDDLSTQQDATIFSAQIFGGV